MLIEVPLFPLPGVQLFPYALMPLHIFEPRYRRLTRDALDGDRRFAIGALAPGSRGDEAGTPAVLPYCGLGEIVAHEAHPDGRYHLLVRGVVRLRILAEPASTHPYRVIRAERLEDLYRPGVDLALAQQGLLAVCERLAVALPEGGETLRALCRQAIEPAATADVLAAALITAPELRQRLLETLDVAERLEQVTAALVALLGRFEAAAPTGAN